MRSHTPTQMQQPLPYKQLYLKRNNPLARQYSVNAVVVSGSPGMVHGCKEPWLRLYPCTKTSNAIEIKDQNLNF
ncbi:MAG: hypothetical protein ABI666_09990 [Ferruginibacter sp.]